MHQGAGKPTLFQCLAQTVNQFLGSFGQIPLGMTAETGTIVHNGQQQGISIFALRQQHSQRTVMKIQMPQCIDKGTLITSDLPRLKPQFGLNGSRTMGRTTAGTFDQSVGFHVTQYRWVGRRFAQVGFCFDQSGQVIAVQLVTPVGMLVILGVNQLALSGV